MQEFQEIIFMCETEIKLYVVPMWPFAYLPFDRMGGKGPYSFFIIPAVLALACSDISLIRMP